MNSAPYQGYEERVFEAERGGDGEHGVEAAQQSPKQDELPNVRLHRQTSQVETQRCQVLCVVQGILTHSMHMSLSSDRVLLIKTLTGRSGSVALVFYRAVNQQSNLHTAACRVLRCNGLF